MRSSGSQRSPVRSGHTGKQSGSQAPQPQSQPSLPLYESSAHVHDVGTAQPAPWNPVGHSVHSPLAQTPDPHAPVAEQSTAHQARARVRTVGLLAAALSLTPKEAELHAARPGLVQPQCSLFAFRQSGDVEGRLVPRGCEMKQESVPRRADSSSQVGVRLGGARRTSGGADSAPKGGSPRTVAAKVGSRVVSSAAAVVLPSYTRMEAPSPTSMTSNSRRTEAVAVGSTSSHLQSIPAR